MGLSIERIGANLAGRFSLQGKVAVVFAGGGVLAGAVAQGYAEAGAGVAVCDIHEPNGRARVDLIRAAGGEAEFFKVDATDPVSLHSAHEAILSSLGAPSILFNGTGGNHSSVIVGPDLPLERIPFANWMKSFELNFGAGILLPCNEFGPGMAARHQGSIITIASVSAVDPLFRVPAYAMAKAALVNYSAYLAGHYAKDGVRVNYITPGYFPAGQNKGLLFNDDGSLTPRGITIQALTVLGHRFGKPEEIVGPAILLASDASSFMTGVGIPVDGGYYGTGRLFDCFELIG